MAGLDKESIARIPASLGAARSVHPLRRARQRAEGAFYAESARAQILIAIAGAPMVVIVGDSMARAFGLVGTGSFIRFRAAIKNPRDIAFLFLSTGSGMACESERCLIPGAIAGFILLLLCVVVFRRPAKPPPPGPSVAEGQASRF